jgi:hypothetical protein
MALPGVTSRLPWAASIYSCSPWNVSSAVDSHRLLLPLQRLPLPSCPLCPPQARQRHLPCRMDRPPQVLACLRDAIAATRRISLPGCGACAFPASPILVPLDSSYQTSFSVTTASATCRSRTRAIGSLAEPSRIRQVRPGLPLGLLQLLLSWQLALARVRKWYLRACRRHLPIRLLFLPPVLAL